MSKNVTIITEPTGKRFALINDLRFKGKTKEEWKEILSIYRFVTKEDGEHE